MMKLSKGLSIVLTLFVLLSFGCGKKRLDQGLSDEQLYQQAVEMLESKKRGFPWVFSGTEYKTLFKILKEIQLRDPYSKYSILAELKTADAYFQKGEYEQAAIEYEEFLKRHPGSEEAPYATYRLALSHYKQVKKPDRDPTSTREALKWFEFFVEKYPESPLIGKANEKISGCRNRLAMREIYIGNYYAKRKNFKAAANRYNVVVSQYSDTKEFEEALYLLGNSYFKMGDNILARATLKRVVDEFPDTEYRKKAESLLQEIDTNTKEESKEG
ncbi:MAG TPA: outer membrane protein assembly factor BamD [Thermodesulfobacteriota bacterium]|jgi:outer membrane protein assembly factor BamD